MASFADRAEFDKLFVNAFVNGHQAYWIGLKKSSEGKWQWNNGKPAVWTNWWISQPYSEADHNCVIIHLGKWWDTDCSTKTIGVICEKPSG